MRYWLNSTDVEQAGHQYQVSVCMFFSVIVFIAFYVLASCIFNNMKTKLQRESFLMLPACNLEKFVARLLMMSIGVSLANAADTIKVGILHSLSGTMAISETTLKDTMLMLIEEQNKAGGLLGKKIEPVVVDPASNWPLFAEKAKELLQKEKVDVMFGCWTSVS